MRLKISHFFSGCLGQIKSIFNWNNGSFFWVAKQQQDPNLGKNTSFDGFRSSLNDFERCKASFDVLGNILESQDVSFQVRVEACSNFLKNAYSSFLENNLTPSITLKIFPSVVGHFSYCCFYLNVLLKNLEKGIIGEESGDFGKIKEGIDCIVKECEPLESFASPQQQLKEVDFLNLVPNLYNQEKQILSVLQNNLALLRKRFSGCAAPAPDGFMEWQARVL